MTEWLVLTQHLEIPVPHLIAAAMGLLGLKWYYPAIMAGWMLSTTYLYAMLGAPVQTALVIAGLYVILPWAIGLGLRSIWQRRRTIATP